MKLFNILSAYELENDDDHYFLHAGLSILLRVLAPITPHICHHIWQELDFEKAIIDVNWPRVDKNALKNDEVDYVVQINGKLRAQFTADSDCAEEELISLAKQHTQVFLKGKSIQKAIVVNHRQLINLVIH